MAKAKITLTLSAAKAKDKPSIDIINSMAAKLKRGFHETARLLIEAGAKAMEAK